MNILIVIVIGIAEWGHRLGFFKRNDGFGNPFNISWLPDALSKEKGQISSNCPKKGTTTESGGKFGGGKGGGKDKNHVTNPYKMKPKDGESLVKTINGQEWFLLW